MSESPLAHDSLVVTTNHSEYYVIPKEALTRFQATEQERERIDDAAGALAPGSFAHLRAGEASAKPSFASANRITLLAWFQDW